MNYAGFWPRFWALLIDALVMLPFGILSFGIESFSKTAALISTIPFTALFYSYNIFFHAKWGQTLGKMATRVKVVKVDGSSISWKNAVLRSSVDILVATLDTISRIIALSKISNENYLAYDWTERMDRLSELQPDMLNWVLPLGFLWTFSEIVVLLTNKKKRALHDFIAGTVVIDLKDDTIRGKKESIPSLPDRGGLV